MVQHRSKSGLRLISSAGKRSRPRRCTSKSGSLVFIGLVVILSLALYAQSGNDYTTEQLLSQAVANAQIVQTSLQEMAANSSLSFNFPAVTSNDISLESQTTTPFSPPKCTNEQLEIIQKQLDPDRCRTSFKYPWRNMCSFSFATRCPDAQWLVDFYQYHRPTTTRSSAIYIGCNKGTNQSSW